MAKMAKRKKPARKAPRKAAKRPVKKKAKRQAPAVKVFTLARLQAAGACQGAIDEFRRLFGTSAPLNAETLRKVHQSEYMSLSWLGMYLGGTAYTSLVDAEYKAESAGSAAYKRASERFTIDSEIERAIEKIQARRDKADAKLQAKIDKLEAQIRDLEDAITEVEEESLALDAKTDREIEELEDRRGQLDDKAERIVAAAKAKAEAKALAPKLPKLVALVNQHLPDALKGPGSY